jgi:Tol biopolymer transport system component
MQLIQPSGARPKWSPRGDQFVFDRRNADGLYDLYVASSQGQLLSTLSEGWPMHYGNGIFRPRGDYVVFMRETQPHFLDFLAPYGQTPYGEPGLGLFNQLWATDGINYWQLTNAPVKMTASDEIPVIATVNPHFSWDSSTLVWTERYGDGGNNNWGRWRLKAANFVVGSGGPRLTNARVLYTPAQGNYVTAMEFMGPHLLLVAGNLDGQHEYEMDLYLLQTDTGSVHNLTTSADSWEEGACVAPSGKIVYISNQDSRYLLEKSKDWVGQPIERDYWMMNPDGSGKERLTYFNDPTAPEYQGWRSVSIICGMSPDGRTMVGTVGRDLGTETYAWPVWQLWLMRFHDPL